MEATPALRFMKPTALTAKRLPVIQFQIPIRRNLNSATSKKMGKAVSVKAMGSPEQFAMGEEVQKEWMDISIDKFKERGDEGGIVELMECLERESTILMGDDEGKHPNDYNRRAQIFDKTSKMFQSLNQLQLQTTDL